MSANDKAQLPFGQASDADRPSGPRSALADRERWLDLLRQAMRDTGWTCDALDAHWGTSRGYAHRLVSGEKPWSVDRLLSLPDDLEARFEQLRAESFGAVVVVPIADRMEAMKATCAGLLGLMSAPQLPAKAAHPAKADLRVRAAKASNE